MLYEKREKWKRENPLELIMPWRKKKQESNEPPPPNSFKFIYFLFNLNRMIEKKNIISHLDLASVGGVEALLINPPWNFYDQTRPIFNMDHFNKLNLPNKLIPQGIIFIWVEKEVMLPVMHHLERFDFYYIENVVWVKVDSSKVKG